MAERASHRRVNPAAVYVVFVVDMVVLAEVSF